MNIALNYFLRTHPNNTDRNNGKSPKTRSIGPFFQCENRCGQRTKRPSLRRRTKTHQFQFRVCGGVTPGYQFTVPVNGATLVTLNDGLQCRSYHLYSGIKPQLSWTPNAKSQSYFNIDARRIPHLRHTSQRNHPVHFNIQCTMQPSPKVSTRFHERCRHEQQSHRRTMIGWYGTSVPPLLPTVTQRYNRSPQATRYCHRRVAYSHFKSILDTLWLDT